ncbi:hypothetical protein D3C78_03230 [compost metagenome]
MSCGCVWAYQLCFGCYVHGSVGKFSNAFRKVLCIGLETVGNGRSTGKYGLCRACR